jgi:Na+-driven multidrug efflux pump
MLLSPLCLRLLRVPADICGCVLPYARIYFAGMAPPMTCNIGAGILRAVGKFENALLIAASIANAAPCYT